MTSKEDELENTTTYLYDKLNRQTQSTSELAKVYEWEYDGNGNIVSRTDANEDETLYTYDSLNRLTEIEYPDLSTVTFDYDDRGNMTQMVDPNGTSTYTYDVYNRMLTANDANGNEVGYEYDDAGNIVTLTYPNNKDVTYTYDANNRMASVTDWNSKTTTYTYNDNGTVALKTYPNTTTAEYSYDEANRLSDIVHKQSTTTKATYAYTRNSLGFITSETYSGTWIGTGRTNDYTYDALGRLLTATYGNDDDFTYTYDAVGNLLTKKINTGTPIQYSYNDDNVLTAVDYPGGTSNDLTIITDDNGNMTKKDGVSGSYDDVDYTYDYENRLTSVDDGTFIEEYFKYDGLGRRIETDDGSWADEQVNDVSGELPRLIAVADDGYVEGMVVHGLNPISYGGSVNSTRGYMYEDAIGSMKYRKSYTGSGSYGGLMEYEPFGDHTYGSGQLPSYRFHSQLLNSNSGELYYMNARYYDAELNRFISRDPFEGILANPQTQNPYAYALNNPVNFSDPSGEFAVAAIPLAGACVAGVVAYGVATLPAVQTAVGNVVSGAVNAVSTLFEESTRSSVQDKRLTKGEIDRLKSAGEDIHGIKTGKGTDLFKTKSGDIIEKPLDGSGEGIGTGLNINNY
jgi:RHS repeat-associated protein